MTLICVLAVPSTCAAPTFSVLERCSIFRKPAVLSLRDPWPFGRIHGLSEERVTNPANFPLAYCTSTFLTHRRSGSTSPLPAVKEDWPVLPPVRLRTFGRSALSWALTAMTQHTAISDLIVLRISYNPTSNSTTFHNSYCVYSSTHCSAFAILQARTGIFHYGDAGLLRSPFVSVAIHLRDRLSDMVR